MVREYLEEVVKLYKGGDAAERTYYPILKQLLEQAGAQTVKIEPRHSLVGIPDLKAENQKGELIGYVEAKAAGRDLDNLNKGEREQIEGYRKEYPNLIVTNFTQFRFFRDGKIADTVKICEPVMLEMGQAVLTEEGHLQTALAKFMQAQIPQSRTASQLAALLAVKGQTLKKLITEEINLEDELATSTEKLLEAFHKTLNPKMTAEEFADMYAQAIIFGLFTARLHFEGDSFSLEKAHRAIPHSNPLLKRVFQILVAADTPHFLTWTIEDIAEVLAKADMERIKEEFYNRGKGKDPLFHFYEPFLAEYSPQKRKQMGVYYTPLPVVQFITRSVQELLASQFGKDEGFADSTVTVLDPAAGTMTFTAQAIALAHEKFVEKNGSGGWGERVQNHILKDFFAFELLMGPYTVGHLKIALQLATQGYEMKGDDRFPLYLTNALDMETYQLQTSAFEEVISEESQKAGEIKKKQQVLVVMGNPPYSGVSANMEKWITGEIDKYRFIDGVRLKENKDWLNDDYVKFFRLAQLKIESGEGIVAYITNHGWLDNPTFRGMRYSFLKTFDTIYILNLHGSALKKEPAPEGIRDEGVFGIQPGTAITIGVKRTRHSEGMATVKYADLWGLRKSKFEWLEQHSLDNTEWMELKPVEPAYFFVEKNMKGWSKYEKFAAINEIFPISCTGIVTARDELVIDMNKASLKSKISHFSNPAITTDEAKEYLKNVLHRSDVSKVENYAWRAEAARAELQKVTDYEAQVRDILYRPFDKRFIFYHPSVVWRTRGEVMKNMLADNMGLLYTRPQAPTYEFSCLVFDGIIDQCVVGNKSAGGGISYIAPLFLVGEQKGLFDNKQPNIDFSKLPRSYADKTPEEIFYYIYAVLYSPGYRKKYAEFLKTDFPRVPMTEDDMLFGKLARAGEKLVELHLLKTQTGAVELHKYEGAGENMVEEVRYEGGKIYINSGQYFDRVSEQTWGYMVGGYQVLAKWLKDRKGRRLGEEDRMTYRKIICALEETMKIQGEIDECILLKSRN